VLLYSNGVELSPHVLYSEEAWRNYQTKRQSKEFLILLCCYIGRTNSFLKFEIS